MPGQVSALTAGDTLLGHFWELASLEEDKREGAAQALVDELLKNQKEFENSASDESDEEEEGEGAAQGKPVDHALRRCSPLMVYAFKRLCRGLGSSRQGARQGFALAITSLLASQQCKSLGPAEAVAAIEGVLEPAGKGTELRDALLGRIFGYAAVARCGCPLPADLVLSMAAGLVGAAGKKSFLREVAGAVLLELCQASDDSALSALVSGPLAPWLTAPPADASPDALLLALRLWPRLPPAAAAACPLLPSGLKLKQLPGNLFTDPAAAVGSKAAAAVAAAFFTRQHLTTLLPVLRGTTQSHPRLHSVWTTLLALLIPGFSADKEQRSAAGSAAARPAPACLEAFWSVVVDGDLVQSSHERKYLALRLFLLLLPHLGPEQVGMVFTPAFLRCLATNLKKGDSYLHASAKKCMERIAGYCDKAPPEVRIAVSLALQRHGGGAFDKFIKANTKGAPVPTEAVDKEKAGGKEGGAAGAAGAAAAAAATAEQAEGLQQYVRQLQDTFLQAGSTADQAEDTEGAGAGAQQRQWAVEQLCGVLKQAAAPAEAKHSVLHFLAVHAFFSVDGAAAKKSKDPVVKAAARCVDVPLAQRQLCAARLISLADSLDKRQQQHPHAGKKQQGQQGQQPPSAQQQQAPQQEYLVGVAAFVADLRQSGAAQLATAGEGQEAAAAAAEEAAATLQDALQRLQARQASGAGTEGPRDLQRMRALGHLLRLLMLHSLADPASADASLAADLATVYDVAIEGQAAPQEEDAEMADAEVADGDADVAPPHWHDTLMDVLLSLLARNAAPLPSAPLRDAVEHVFRAFADDLTATGMQDMLRVLGKPLDSGAQDEEEDLYASEDEEEEEEGEKQDGAEEEEEKGSDSEEEEEEAVEAEEGSGSEEEEEEKEVASGSGSDDDGMTDEAMFAMDSKLASYFATLKEGRGGGSAGRAARDELINFKMRVAGLVEAFCKRMPASPLLLTAVAPLLAGLAGASRPGGHQALAERLSGLVTNKLCGSKAEAAGAGVQAEGLEQQLRRTLYLASRATDKRVATAASACYVFLQRAAAASPDAGCRAKGAESACAAVADFFVKKKSRLQRTQMEGLLRRVPALLPAVLPAVLKQAAAARNEYLQTEAFLLLGAVVKAKGAAVSSALATCAPAAALAVTAAASGKFSKPQRQVEALKVMCQLLEAAAKADASLAPAGSAASWQEARAAAASACDAAAGNPKLSAALQRLEGLLGALPAGTAGKAPGKAGKAAEQAGGKTPGKAAKPAAQPAGKTPAKTVEAGAAEQPAGKTPGKTPGKAGKAAGKTPAKTPAEAVEPVAAEQPAGKTPGKAGKTPGKTPGKAAAQAAGRTPGKRGSGGKQGMPGSSGKKQKV